MASVTTATRRTLVMIVMLMALPAAAEVIHDPWLARFQVGEFRDPDTIVLTDGWPAGLLEPLAIDPAWLDGAAAFFRTGRWNRGSDLESWRLAFPAMRSVERARIFYDRARRQWLALRALDAGRPADAGLDGPWRRALRLRHAGGLWERGAWNDAAEAASGIVRDAETLGLSQTEAFAWRMRAACLAVRAGRPVRTDSLWTGVADLGSYDTRSGWALWLAVRRAAGADALPGHAPDRDTALVLADAGKLWMPTRDFLAAGFPPDVEAGVGALLLPASALKDHFTRHPDPPADGLLQGYWLRGSRRLDGGAAALETLAARPDLKDGHRLDLWRRASEKRLLADRWKPGLADLEAALRLADSGASAGVVGRLREWTVQAMALALARGRTGNAGTVVALADRYLEDAQMVTFRTDAAALLARIGQPRASTGDDLRSRSEVLVRRGKAPDLATGVHRTLPEPDAWRHRLWSAWARWGLALASDAVLGLDDRDYRAGLRAILAADDPAQRHATACAVVAGRLAGSPTVPRLLDFAVQRDIERLAGGAAMPAPTPVPELRESGPWRDLEARWRGHALMGAALALGDDRGMLSVAVRLPAGGVEEAVRRLFWYPLPADPAVRRTLLELDLPAEILLAIARNESHFEPAVRSRAGALGYMQIMPFHYDDPAGPPGPSHWSHPAASLRAGARILATEVRRFGGDPYRAVAAYNAGGSAVKRWDGQLGGGADREVFWAWISYPETRDYTLRVLRDREVYRGLLEAAR